MSAAPVTSDSSPIPLNNGLPEDAELRTRADAALRRAVDALLSKQHADGHWCAELEGDSILQSEWVLMKWILGEEDDPRIVPVLNYLRLQQREDGSWGQYPGGKVGGGAFDLSAAVKAYLCLKLAGDDLNAPHMVKARQLILQHGGAERINSFSKFYLACLGQVSFNAVPLIPAQLVYLPKWFFFHLDKVSAWSRTMILPLSIITVTKPVRQLRDDQHITELFADPANRDRLLSTGFQTGKRAGWTHFFLWADRLLKWCDRLHLLRMGEETALQWMEEWMIRHCEKSDGPGAIFPPIVYLLIAFCTCRGYRADHPLIQANREHLDHYMIHGRAGLPRNTPADNGGDDTIRLQPCESPVWDTGIAAYALTDAGLTIEHEAMRRCADWLLAKEVRTRGDWANNLHPTVKPAGWFFEYHNELYPDVDDTVMVAKALKRMGGRETEQAGQRGVEWVLAMQNSDGGWAAFDKTEDRPLLECVPFADHNAIQDPSCPDITGRTLECLSWYGYTVEHPAVRRAIQFIRSRQEPEGCWFGRWGVNYIYGTWQSIGGLRGVGYDMTTDWVQKAGRWLKSVQQADGSFGESADSYENPALKGQGPSTASQTAWGVMSLLTIYGPHDENVRRGIQWLCETQLTQPRADTNDPAGSWHEPWFTGTGFPKVFYLRYHLYRLYFPVMCLGRWLRLHRAATADA